MRRNDLTKAIGNIVDCVKESHLSDILISRPQAKKIEKSAFFEGYAMLKERSANFGPAEETIIDVFGIRKIFDPQFWTELVSAPEELKSFPQIRHAIYHIEEFLPKLEDILIRESDKKFLSENSELGGGILRVIIKDDGTELSAKHLSNIIVDVTELYEIVVKLYKFEHDELRIGSIDSGSDKSFDFIGAADGITKLSKFVLECWDRVRFSSHEKLEKSIKTSAEGLSLLAQIKDQVDKNIISKAEGEKMKRVVLNNIDNLFQNGVYTNEMEQAVPVRPSELTYDRQKSIEFRPVGGRSDAYFSIAETQGSRDADAEQIDEPPVVSKTVKKNTARAPKTTRPKRKKTVRNSPHPR